MAALQVEFRQVGRGFMDMFEGRWSVKPLSARQPAASSPHPWMNRALASMQHGLGMHKSSGSLATFEQCMRPAMVPPGRLGQLVTRAPCCYLGVAGWDA